MLFKEILNVDEEDHERVKRKGRVLEKQDRLGSVIKTSA